MSMFSLGFATASLAKIAQFLVFSMGDNITAALVQSGDIVTQNARTYAWSYFENPTGRLSNAITPTLLTTRMVSVEANTPYAWRREAGFNGPDSLGRVYHDPPYFFMSDAMIDSTEQVYQVFADMGMHVTIQLSGI